MVTTISQKIKIGIFTIAGFVVLLAGIFVIGNKRNLFGKTFNVYGDFKNISGLQIGNNVRFSGIDIGTVEGINIINDSTIRVTMTLKSKISRFLKDDALASIGTDGLMGDKLINISPGPDGQKSLPEGGRIMTVNPTDYSKIIDRISKVADHAEEITSSLAGIARQINSGKGSLGKLIYSEDLEKGITGTLKSIHETVDTAERGVEGFNQNMNAAKHNFLLRGYFKKKARKEQEKQEEKEQH